MTSPHSYHIAVLPGDGIGPEVTEQAGRVLEAVQGRLHGIELRFSEHSVGAGEYLQNGDPLPEAAFEACREADAVLLGAMGLPEVRWPDGREMTPQIDLRERLDLYAGPRPIYLYSADDTPLKGYGSGEIDFVIVRENTEGLFSARGAKQAEDGSEASDVLRLTRKGCERICRFAFEEATGCEGKVTLVDKANVLPSMVFFRRIFEEVARDYPDIRTECLYVDAAALHLVQRPESFDVIVTENLYGDILSDLAAGLVGGLGMAPSGDVGEDCGVFQPAHGSAPDIAGHGKANPIAAILSGAMLLDWLGHHESQLGAQLIRDAVRDALEDPKARTPDLGGSLSTSELGDLVVQAL